MLNLNYLPDDTQKVFEYFASNSTFADAGMRLMGGTALSLLIGHRLSEDLDFFCFHEELPTQTLSHVISQLKSTGFSVMNIMDQSRLSQARINGIRLEQYIQEYAINGVKVSFGVMAKGSKSRAKHFNNAPTIDFNGSFSIPDLKTLFESKSVVLMDRVKSRDLFDLMVLIKDHGFSVSDVIQTIIKVDDQDETKALTALEVMIGNIPVDKDDPGFDSIALDVGLDEIYAFLKEKVDDYEQEISSQFLRR